MSTSRSSGIGLPGVLLVVFIILKLTHLISWSWVWVLSPLWITLLIYLVIFLAIFVLVWLKS